MVLGKRYTLLRKAIKRMNYSGQGDSGAPAEAASSARQVPTRTLSKSSVRV